MIEEQIEALDSLRKDKSEDDRQVKVKLKFELKFRGKIVLVRYFYNTRAIETMETIQFWLGMKFGFNIIGILLG